MNHDARQDALERLYGPVKGMAEEAYDALLDRSLGPRDSSMLLDVLARRGVGAGQHVLDIGCRDARYAVAIADRFACTLTAIDPLAHHIAQATRRVQDGGHASRVTVRAGRIEAIPAGEGAFDVIWCRDVLSHVPDLRAGLAECERVLARHGFMVIYQTFATPLLEATEAAWIYPALAVVPENMSPETLERHVHAVGLRIVERDDIGSEWRERWEEDGRRDTSHQLLRIARMRRDRDRLVAALGQSEYDSELANCHWGVYQMLGKLHPRVFVVEKS
jgi:2-polyprenyl-3-methyl-5-hydroxy-6-metoxy-1,4-benzoquinol methylase